MICRVWRLVDAMDVPPNLSMKSVNTRGAPGILCRYTGMMTPNMAKAERTRLVTLLPVKYTGMRVNPAAPMKAYHGSPMTTTMTTTTRVIELNEGKLSPRANVFTLAVSAPAIAAMKAEMQKTTTRMTLTFNP